MRILLAMILCAVPTATLPAQVGGLRPGDPAPRLAVAEWLRGPALADFTRERCYAVVFWAAWSKPCRDALTQLTALQRRHPDQLTVLGITSVDDENPKTAVTALLTERGDGIGFPIGWDDAQQTHEAWLRAAGQDDIPCAFLVDRTGVVVWMGHPLWLEVAAPLVVGADGPLLPGTVRDAVGAIETRVTDAYLTAVTKPEQSVKDMAALVAEHPFVADMVENNVFVLLLQGGQPALAKPIGERLVRRAEAKRDAEWLNELAWSIVNPDVTIRARDLDTALRAAEAAVALTAEKDGNFLDTLARVWFWKKELPKALALQEKAVTVDPDRQDLKRALGEYRAALGRKSP